MNRSPTIQGILVTANRLPREDLASAIEAARGGCNESRGRIAMSFMRLATTIAKRYLWTGAASLEELMSDAFLWMHTNAHRFDPDRGLSATTYFASNLKWHFRRRCGLLPRERRARPVPLSTDVACAADTFAAVDCRDAVDQCLRSVSLRHESVLRSRYLKGNSLQIVGASLGVSCEYARQLEQQAIAGIRRRLARAG